MAEGRLSLLDSVATKGNWTLSYCPASAKRQYQDSEIGYESVMQLERASL